MKHLNTLGTDIFDQVELANTQACSTTGQGAVCQFRRSVCNKLTARVPGTDPCPGAYPETISGMVFS